MSTFSLDYIDHVAINVKDMNASALWYEKVLGLKKLQLKEWGAYPIFMLSGSTGIALFPAEQNTELSKVNPKSIRIDHFAFRVTNANFEKAKNRFDELALTYVVKDLHYFHSIYIEDLDGHTVELTTLVVDEKELFKINA